MNENDRISIQISLKFVLKSLIDNKTALLQVKACCLEAMMTQFTDAYMRHYGRWVNKKAS